MSLQNKTILIWTVLNLGKFSVVTIKSKNHVFNPVEPIQAILSLPFPKWFFLWDQKLISFHFAVCHHLSSITAVILTFIVFGAAGYNNIKSRLTPYLFIIFGVISKRHFTICLNFFCIDSSLPVLLFSGPRVLFIYWYEKP